MLFLLTTLAFAQDEACEPVELPVLVAQLDKAEELLAKADPGGADAHLGEAQTGARCLTVPFPPDQLARLAMLNAERAIFNQDDEAMWRWIRLAADAKADAPWPPHVDDTHPVRQQLAEPPETPPVRGPAKALAIPKKGKVYADGALLSEPRLRLSTPHLIQVFGADGALLLAYWQMGAGFRQDLLTQDAGAAPTKEQSKEFAKHIPPPNWKPAKIGTEQAYREWVKKHPKGPWLQEAIDAIDDLHWYAAAEDGSELAIKTYVHQNPKGLHVDEANFAVEQLDYRAAMAASNREDWEAFLEVHPDGIYAAEARLQLDIVDFRQAQKDDSAAAFSAYLDAHPEGRSVIYARQMLEERELDLALEKGTDSALEAFLEAWPEGKLQAVARAALGEAKFEEVHIEVSGEDVEASVLDRIRADLGAEMEKRGFKLADAAGSGIAELVVSVLSEPGESISKKIAQLQLVLGDLPRPLATLNIEVTLLAGDTGEEQLATFLVQNLRSFRRWHPNPPPEPEKVPAVVEPVPPG